MTMSEIHVISIEINENIIRACAIKQFLVSRERLSLLWVGPSSHDRRQSAQIYQNKPKSINTVPVHQRRLELPRLSIAKESIRIGLLLKNPSQNHRNAFQNGALPHSDISEYLNLVNGPQRIHSVSGQLLLAQKEQEGEVSIP